MSKDWYQDIVDFHKLFEHHIGAYPGAPPADIIRLRRNLIEEEVKETIEAMSWSNIEGIADGIADSIVVLLGTAVSYGIDLRPIWDEVHRTNMAKVGGERRPDGKTLKPEGWQPPRIRELLEAQHAKDTISGPISERSTTSD